MNAKIEYLDHLVNHLLAHNSPQKMEKALSDLLTASELDEVAKRLQIFEMLAAGVPQRQIAESLGVGIATVSRGSSVLKKHRRI
ncbi:MAG: Trp family transcriptional regulator [Thermodesulfobacteriota bacterium]|nr:Trp family transcriptional regulator [Thermodesulfobacteriota bacterium]